MTYSAIHTILYFEKTKLITIKLIIVIGSAKQHRTQVHKMCE
jgi:hypothetical protein